MKKLEKIEIGTDDNAFDWILKEDRNACESIQNSQMIRELVKRHNEMVGLVNELILHIVIKAEGDSVCPDCGNTFPDYMLKHKKYICYDCGNEWAK